MGFAWLPHVDLQARDPAARSDLQTGGMSFVFQQELMGAGLAYPRETEAVEAAPWPRLKQAPGEIGMFV